MIKLSYFSLYLCRWQRGVDLFDEVFFQYVFVNLKIFSIFLLRGTGHLKSIQEMKHKIKLNTNFEEVDVKLRIN